MKHTLTIGIPAYNEESNIKKILDNLIIQEINNADVKRIVVISDCSTDSTNEIVNTYTNPLVKLVVNPTRTGKPIIQHNLIKKTNTKILIILDADIMIEDIHFIEKLIRPIIKGDADLTSAKVEELTPKTFLEKILYASMKLKKYIYSRFKNGNNIYNCHGRARAFSKKLYKLLEFDKVRISEDAYTYLKCIKSNNRFKYIDNTSVYYRLPEIIRDHENQSVRFFSSKIELKKFFSQSFLEKEYKIPFRLLITSFLYFLIRYPIITFYIPILIYSKLSSVFIKKNTNAWNISKSTKTLITK